mgnify:CR=1 FL=1
MVKLLSSVIAIKINLYVKLKFKDPVIYVLFLLFLYVLLRVIYVYNIYFLLFYFLLSSFLISVAAVQLAFKNTRAEIFTTNVCFGRLLTTENTAYIFRYFIFFFLHFESASPLNSLLKILAPPRLDKVPIYFLDLYVTYVCALRL